MIPAPAYFSIHLGLSTRAPVTWSQIGGNGDKRMSSGQQLPRRYFWIAQPPLVWYQVKLQKAGTPRGSLLNTPSSLLILTSNLAQAENCMAQTLSIHNVGLPDLPFILSCPTDPSVNSRRSYIIISGTHFATAIKITVYIYSWKSSGPFLGPRGERYLLWETFNYADLESIWIPYREKSFCKQVLTITPNIHKHPVSSSFVVVIHKAILKCRKRMGTRLQASTNRSVLHKLATLPW